MNKNVLKAIVPGLLLVVLVSACMPGASAQNERFQSLEEKLDSIAAIETELASLRGEVADLQSRLDEVSVKIAAVETVGNVENPSDIALAQYVLDTAEFHGMAETLAETKLVDPAYLGTVNRVHKVLSVISWPDSLVDQGQAFLTQLDEFRAALEANNGEEAARLADLTHEAQHDLSHTIDEYLVAGGHED